MLQATAVEHLEDFMRGLQRTRSTVREQISATEEVLTSVHPYLFGPKNPLKVLGRILDDVDLGKELSPMTYYNMMVFLERFLGIVKDYVNVQRLIVGKKPIPEGAPDIAGLMGGWDTPIP